MRTRQEMKRNAKHTVKKHYMELLILCLVAAFFGTEFKTSTAIFGLGKTTSETSAESIDMFEDAEEVFHTIVSGDVEEGKEEAEDKIAAYENEDDTGKVVGHSRGVLASITNKLTSGALIVQVAEGIYSIVQSKDVTSGILIVVSLILFALVWSLVFNVYQVILRRMFLEARTYKKVPIYHVFHLKAIHRYVRAAMTVLLKYIYLTLWSLTIVGGVIKMYSYALVPFIAAENADIKPREAIKLSRKMMDGHKWQLFSMQVTFIGWYILAFITSGLSNLLYFNSYSTAFYSEFYTEMRKLAKENQIEGAERLNDDYLFEIAPEEVRKETYKDILEEQQYINEHRITLTGIRKFLANNLSIWIGSTKDKNAYQDLESRKYRVEKEIDALNGDQYPIRLGPLYDKKHLHLAEDVQFLRVYSIWSLLLLFFTFSIIGWLWEVSLHLISDGVFVNRGTMFGPWLPIYGSGGVVALTLLTRTRESQAKTFFGAMILCGCIEYFTSYYLEMKYGIMWWDYTGYFLNLNGRICAEGLTVFGAGCCAVIYIIAPYLDIFFSKVSPKILSIVSIVLVLLYGTDSIYSHKHPNTGKGITATRRTAYVTEIKKM